MSGEEKREEEEEDGRGSTTLWHGVQSSLSLQHTGVIGFGAFILLLFCSFFIQLYLYSLSSLLCTPFTLPNTHAQTVILSHSNTCHSSAVYPGETN